MSNEQQTTKKEETAVQYKIISRHLIDDNGNTTKNLGQDILSPGRDQKAGAP
jgi:hypothetical protein